MTPIRTLLVATAVAGVLWAGTTRPWALDADQGDPPWIAPEFTHDGVPDWINTPPLDLADLRGKVVLLDFWSYGCWNCRRSFPFIKDLKHRFGDEGLAVIGIHTPEFKHEMNRARVKAHVEEFNLEHPVMVDNDFSYWKAMRNRYWPTFYLVDKSGRVRGRIVGEVRAGNAGAQEMKSLITALLAETR